MFCSRRINPETNTSVLHGWDFSGFSWISGFRCISGSNKNGFGMHFEVEFSPFRIQTLAWSHAWFCFLYTPPPPPPTPNTGGGISESLCSSVCLSDHVRSVSPEPLNHFKKFFTRLCIVMYYHEVMCYVEKLVHYLQCQGHSCDYLYYIF